MGEPVENTPNEQKHDPVTRIHGNVGRDPEQKNTTAGDLVTFSVACNRTYARDSETFWFNVAVWKPELAAMVMEQVHKGSKVAVEGFLRKRQYEGQDGQLRTSLDLSATRVGLVDWFQYERVMDDGPVVEMDYGSDDLDDLPF